MEEVAIADTALKSTLLGVYLRIHLHDRFAERRASFDLLGFGASFFKTERFVFHHRVKLL